jgi:hypothetical protein
MQVFLKREDPAGGGSHARAHAHDSAADLIAYGFRVYFCSMKPTAQAAPARQTGKKNGHEGRFFEQGCESTATATRRRTTGSATTATGGLGVHKTERTAIVTVFEFDVYAIQRAQALRIHEHIQARG